MDAVVVYGPFLTLKQARKKGLSWFWVGQRCKWGHYSESHVQGGCRVCKKLNAKIWQQENKERAYAAVTKHRKSEKSKATRRAWREANREKLREQAKEREKRYRREKNNRAIAAAISCRLRAVLRGRAKASNTVDLLGCSIDEFRGHIEAQWLPGMSWENWSKYGWHLDHVRPCASFDLSDPGEQRICFHYTNMQPLWAKDNLRKGDRFSR